jgi:iron complex transport system substrate-binding protein
MPIAIALLIFLSGLSPAAFAATRLRPVTDILERTVQVPDQVDRVICSGSGCLRLLVYLQGQDRAVAVDSAEKGGLPFAVEARPYALTQPQLGALPLFGEFRGHDNPELIAALDPQPQVIFKVNAPRDGGVDSLQTKTGIPVVALGYGNLTHGREELNRTLHIMGEVLGLEQRAEEVISFIDSLQADLEQRVAGIAANDRPTTYLGGLVMRGGHGFASTEPAYAPFAFLGALNVARELAEGESNFSHATVAKEQLLLWDPDVIFLDIASTRLPASANGLEQLRTDAVYQAMTAVQSGRVYGVFPYNYYNTNFESVFANSYFIGSILYPERFADIDPLVKSEEISIFLNGGPAFNRINEGFSNMGFSRIPLR